MPEASDKLSLKFRDVIYEHFTKSNSAKILVGLYALFSIFALIAQQIEYWKSITSIFWIVIIIVWIFLPDRFSSEEHIRAMKKLEYKLGHKGENFIGAEDAEVVQPVTSIKRVTVKTPRTIGSRGN